MRKRISRFFRRKKLSKEQEEKFWSGFFSKTPLEKHLEELEGYEETIECYEGYISRLELPFLEPPEIDREKLIRYWKGRINRMREAKESRIRLWKRLHEEDN